VLLALSISTGAVAEDPKPQPKPTGKVGNVVGKIKGAPNAHIYIEGTAPIVKGSTALMKQEGKQFVPQVLVVQKGTKVDFPNRDAIFHNVFSVTPDNSFDLGSYRQGESRSVNMLRPGVVSVYCNMHPQMVGHILVVPNQHFAAAGKDGFFRIPNVPVGKHKLVAWAPNSKPVTSEIEVTEGEAASVELELKPGRAGPHQNKDGLPYGSYKD
jgi:plastocyanin